ncbi:MAG: sulfatase [Flavobacteriaceae bacterium]
MNTIHFKFLIPLLMLLAISMVCAQGITAPNKKIRPNILWVMAEDIGPDLQCYGMPGVKTPILDKLAQEGVLYTKAYGANSICSPSRSNMITGVHQNVINAQHHRSNRKIPLKAPYKPITSYLRDVGYTCILGSELVRGKGRKIDVNFKHKAIGNWNGKTEFGLFDKFDTITTEDQPFFSQVTLTVTHRGGHWNAIREQSKHKVDPGAVILPPYYADHPVIREDWAKYLDQIEYMDYEMGLLLNDLEKKGLKENTIIIFIGDNGRCNIRGKGYLYDPGLHLPLIVNWPAGLNGGKKDDRLISSIDVAASILDMAGVKLPEYMTAIPFINTDTKGRNYVYSARDLWDEVLEQSRAITTDRYRYIKNNIPNLPYDAHQAYLEFYRPAVHIMRGLKEQGELTELQARFFAAKETEELYDLVNDPFETINLIGLPAYKNTAEQMRAHYRDWNEKNHDFGLDPIDWKNAPPPKAAAVIEWLKKQRPEVIEQMKQGIEPGFGAWSQAYKNRVKE